MTLLASHSSATLRIEFLELTLKYSPDQARHQIELRDIDSVPDCAELLMFYHSAELRTSPTISEATIAALEVCALPSRSPCLLH
jgi:hypothetical protein